MRTASRFPKIDGLFVPPRPTLVRAAPAGAEWVHEIKHDGYRMVAVRHEQDVRLRSRQYAALAKKRRDADKPAQVGPVSGGLEMRV